MRTVLSCEAEIICLSSELKNTDHTLLECPLNVHSGTPLFVSHIIIVLSSDADTILLPSELNDAN